MVGTYAHIRWMIRRDWPEVLSIEQQSFAFPWTETDLARTLREQNCIGFVATDGPEGRVLGHMVFELHKGHIQLLNLAVDPLYRDLGVGRALIVKLQAKLSPYRRTRAATIIRETNLDGLKFLARCGFKAVQLLRDYYEATGEDAVLMQYRLAE